MGRRSYPGNTRQVSVIEFGPGSTSVQLAQGMAIATNTFSPMAAGVHSPGATARGYAMVQGYGVNRMGNDLGPFQRFYGAIQPIATPRNPKLGIGAGVSGQPGMPSTGADATGLALLSVGQFGSSGMGG